MTACFSSVKRGEGEKGGEKEKREPEERRVAPRQSLRDGSKREKGGRGKRKRKKEGGEGGHRAGCLITVHGRIDTEGEGREKRGGEGKREGEGKKGGGFAHDDTSTCSLLSIKRKRHPEEGREREERKGKEGG